jgi:hypothetical protein
MTYIDGPAERSLLPPSLPPGEFEYLVIAERTGSHCGQVRKERDMCLTISHLRRLETDFKVRRVIALWW